MAIIKNSNNNNTYPEKDGQEPALEWKAMKAGIYSKILEEEPTFFDLPKRKRRGAFWLFFSFGALLVGTGILLWTTQNIAPTPITSIHNDMVAETQAGANFSVREKAFDVDNQEVLTTTIAANEESRATKKTTPVLPTPAQITIRTNIQHKNLKVAPIEQPILTNLKEQSGFEAIEKTLVVADKKLFEDEEILNPSFLDVPLKKLVLPIRPINNTYKVQEENHQSVRTNHLIWTISTLVSTSGFKGASPAASLRNDNSNPLVGMGLGVESAIGTTNFRVGLATQAFYQKIDSYTERNTEVAIDQALIGIHHLRVGSITTYEYADTILAGIEKNRLLNYNKLNTIQFRASWGTSFKAGKWEFQPRMGVVVGRVINAEGKTLAADGAIIEYEQDNSIYNNWLVQSTLGIRAVAPMSDKLNLHIGYQHLKQWNNSSNEQDLIYRPTFHELTVGINRQF